MHRLGILFCLSTLLSTSFLLAAGSTLKPIKGTVEIQSQEQGPWVDVKETRPIQEGCRIKTGNGASAFLITEDDHRVAIGPDSFVDLQHFTPGQTTIYLKQGSIRNKVRKLRLDAGQYYKIQTPTAVVAVRGTDFSVMQDQKASVRVFEGTVDLGALRADIHKETLHLKQGESVTMDAQGHMEEHSAKPPEGNAPPQGAPREKKDPDHHDDPHGPNGPPPPGGNGGMLPPSDMGRPAGGGGNWWDHPERMEGTPDFFGGPAPSGMPPAPGSPMEPGRPPAKPPTDNGGPTTFNNPFPYGDPTGNGGTTFGNPPPPFGNPIIPPTGTGGTGTGGGGSTLVGLDALIDTLRSRNLHAQADAILVADLYQRNAVVTDPMTGQLRQYADAVFSSGSDGIKFINATMIAGVPNSLNYTTSLIRFNQPLPAAYWTATQTAFVGGSTPPSWYAVRYLTDISNTVDHLMVDASGGSSFLDTMTSRYVTHFTDIQTSINGIVLWAKNSGGTTYLGGATPTTSVMSTPHADHEVKNTYSDGTYVTVRTMFADDQGTIASMASKPTTMSASSYLDNLNVRTMIRSNLLSKGSLDIFGTAKGRRLSGLMTYDDGEAAAILNGTQSPLGAPIGLLPS